MGTLKKVVVIIKRATVDAVRISVRGTQLARLSRKKEVEELEREEAQGIQSKVEVVPESRVELG